MIGYRVDRRKFSVGDIITVINKGYQEDLEGKKLKVEQILEKQRPYNKISRDKVLFIFKEEEHAFNFWLNEIDGKFYKLKFNIKNINHLGDYDIVERIYNLLKKDPNNPKITQLATNYWNPVNTKVKEEILLSGGAEVIEIVCNDERIRQAYHRKSRGFNLKEFGLGNVDISKFKKYIKGNRNVSWFSEGSKFIFEHNVNSYLFGI